MTHDETLSDNQQQIRAEREARHRETRALVMLRSGDSHLEISATTGLTLEEITRLARDFPSVPTTIACVHPACGVSRHTAGRPKHGWVMVKEAGCPPYWFCGYAHAARYALRRST